MSDKAAIKAAHAFIEAFNDQDHERLAGTLNYPHVRLANGRFVTVDDAESFIARSRKNRTLLADEGWHHTLLGDIRVIHSGPDKVHLALSIDRCHADDTVYNHFETLWIATEQSGHWGIQFRSSYLFTS